MGITIRNIQQAFQKSADALDANSDLLTKLDQDIGDGDLGITAGKMAKSLREYASGEADGNDIGKYLMSAGMKLNSVASSSLGSLIAIALMTAGKTAKGKAEITSKDLADMLNAAVDNMMEKGKAKLGDKTIIDALIPAVETFNNSIQNGAGLSEAAKSMAISAKEGMDKVTPQKSRIGRAGWVGDRTAGKVDPGCALAVAVLEALSE